MSNENWVVYDAEDLTILGSGMTQDEAKEDALDINRGKGTEASIATAFDYEYIVRRRELRAQIAATIYAGVITDGSDGQSTIDWAIERVDKLLAKLRI